MFWCVELASTLNCSQLVTAHSPRLLSYWTHLITLAAYMLDVNQGGAAGIDMHCGHGGRGIR